MQVIAWRVTLIIILLITLIGSIVIVLQEPTLPSIMGVVGAAGSMLGAFVTTGLDITATKRTGNADQRLISHRAPTMEGASQRVTVEGQITPHRSTGVNARAMTIAMTFGALAGMVTGVIYADPLWGLPIRCAQWLSFFAVGATYAAAARNELARGERISVGTGMVGGLISGLIPAVVASIANQLSKLFFYPAYREAMCDVIDCATDYQMLILLGTCMVLITRPLVAGIGGLVAASLLRER